MRKTLCASALVLALCVNALAGDINCPPITSGDIPSPPGGAQSSTYQAADGWAGAEEAAPSADGIIGGVEAESLTAAALTAFNSLLALF